MTTRYERSKIRLSPKSSRGQDACLTSPRLGTKDAPLLPRTTADDVKSPDANRIPSKRRLLQGQRRKRSRSTSGCRRVAPKRVRYDPRGEKTRSGFERYQACKANFLI